MVVFDPLDGSSNIDAGISTGSIFGIYAPSDECSIDDMDDPEKMMQVPCFPFKTPWAASSLDATRLYLSMRGCDQASRGHMSRQDSVLAVNYRWHFCPGKLAS